MNELYYDPSEQLEITKKREYPIRLRNDFIQKTRFNFSLAEVRALNYICSLVKPRLPEENASGEPYKRVYTISVKEYANVCGFSSTSGRCYEMIKDTFTNILSNVVWIKNENGNLTSVHWVEKVTIEKGTGTIIIRLDEDIIPYLYNVQKEFTQYALLEVLPMKSQYSYLIYMYLKSFAYQSSKVVDLCGLKEYLGVDEIPSYQKFKDFRVNILDRAVREINRYTTLEVNYELIKEGRAVKKIRFHMNKKSTHDIIASSRIANEDLGGVDPYYATLSPEDKDFYNTYIMNLAEVAARRLEALLKPYNSIGRYDIALSELIRALLYKTDAQINNVARYLVEKYSEPNNFARTFMPLVRQQMLHDGTHTMYYRIIFTKKKPDRVIFRSTDTEMELYQDDENFPCQDIENDEIVEENDIIPHYEYEQQSMF